LDFHYNSPFKTLDLLNPAIGHIGKMNAKRTGHGAKDGFRLPSFPRRRESRRNCSQADFPPQEALEAHRVVKKGSGAFFKNADNPAGKQAGFQEPRSHRLKKAPDPFFSRHGHPRP